MSKAIRPDIQLESSDPRSIAQDLLAGKPYPDIVHWHGGAAGQTSYAMHASPISYFIWKISMLLESGRPYAEIDSELDDNLLVIQCLIGRGEDLGKYRTAAVLNAGMNISPIVSIINQMGSGINKINTEAYIKVLKRIVQMGASTKLDIRVTSKKHVEANLLHFLCYRSIYTASLADMFLNRGILSDVSIKEMLNETVVLDENKNDLPMTPLGLRMYLAREVHQAQPMFNMMRMLIDKGASMSELTAVPNGVKKPLIMTVDESLRRMHPELARSLVAYEASARSGVHDEPARKKRMGVRL